LLQSEYVIRRRGHLLVVRGLRRRLKGKATRKKYWVYPHFNKDSVIVARELE
jgi:hypothetical protein